MLEDPYEYEPAPINYRPWWLDVLIGIGCAFAFAVIISGLIGCTTTRDAEVCYMKAIGMTEEGYTVAGRFSA